MASKTLLIVDDEAAIVKNLQWAFKNDYNVVTAHTAAEALELVRKRRPGLMVLDLSLTGDPENLEGFRVLEDALAIEPLLKVIVVTGHDEREHALTAIAKGAYDFYAKPVAIENLKIILTRAAQIHSLEKENAKLQSQRPKKEEFAGMIASSSAMESIFAAVRKVAPADVSVLITGESGTGKELIARAVHDLGGRKRKPFVPINCGAIPESLLESELFGHEKGSFTGAHTTRPGKFEIADGGTVFLDEIGELGASLQVKLLRFLQDQAIERVGGRELIQVNVRVVAATNQDLEDMIGERTFREDLFYRINAIRLNLPPLRDRGDDVLLIATRFLHRYNEEFSRSVRGFSDAAIQLLYDYPWPGNVRELENRIKRAVLMTSGKVIAPGDLDLPQLTRSGAPPVDEMPTVLGRDMRTLKSARDDLERGLIIASLLRTRGNVSSTARELDVSRPTLHDLMKKHGVDAGDYRPGKDAE